MPVTPPVQPPPVVETLGTGWTKQFVGISASLSDVFFTSPTNGYAIGANIFKTNDGGTTWTNLNSTAGFLYNMFLTPDDKAFFLNMGSIVKTLDGGLQFSQISLGPGEIHDIFFTDNLTGYCITDNGLFNTTNGGITWNKIITSGLNIDQSRYATLFFLNNTAGCVVSGKKIYRSANSFVNWQEAAITGIIPGHFTSIYAASSNAIYAATDSSQIYKSIDGGVTFSFIKKLPGNEFSDIHFINDNLGYHSNEGQIHKTVDGGVNWSLVVNSRHKFVEIHFTDETHGWAAGDSGVVLRYRP